MVRTVHAIDGLTALRTDALECIRESMPDMLIILVQ